MPLFKVRLYHGADRPAAQFQDIVADDAQQAAEKACGERLDKQKGALEHLRAIVKLPDGDKRAFYTMQA